MTRSMNFMKYALASLAWISIAACNENDDLTEGIANNAEKGYMSLSVEMPGLGTMTRGGMLDGDDKHEGTKGEQHISNLVVIVYDENGVNPEYHTYQGSELKPQAPNPVEPHKTTTYTLPPFAVKQGKKNIVVVVNPLANKFIKGNQVVFTNLADMQKEMKLTEAEIDQISTDNQFMMTNANKLATGNGAVSVTVSQDNRKNNPAMVTVEVERSVAKIEDATQTYTFTVNNSQDQVKFTEVALINGNTKFYPIKKVEKDLNNESVSYILDPNFQNQSAATLQDFYATDFSTFPTGKHVCQLQDNKPVHFYTLGNTMTANEQMNGYTTGLYYKAVYRLANGKDNENVYQYAGRLYNWTSLSKAAAELDLNLSIHTPEGTTTKLTDQSTQDQFDQIGVKKFEKGVCYYTHWIRHIDNENATVMGPMEFAVVRNNYYQMNINSVKGIGEHKPTNPDTQAPDELQETFLDVKVKVLPWIVRKNNIDF